MQYEDLIIGHLLYVVLCPFFTDYTRNSFYHVKTKYYYFSNVTLDVSLTWSSIYFFLYSNNYGAPFTSTVPNI